MKMELFMGKKLKFLEHLGFVTSVLFDASASFSIVKTKKKAKDISKNYHLLVFLNLNTNHCRSPTSNSEISHYTAQDASKL